MKCFNCDSEMKQIYNEGFTIKWSCASCNATYIRYLNQGANYYRGQNVHTGKVESKKNRKRGNRKR